MNCEKTIQLVVGKEFTRLIQPFSHEELLRLYSELSILKPLVFHIWKGILIDEMGYYKLSLQFGIPYEIRPLLKKTREEIIIDICGKQLKRTDLTIMMKKYLIGKISLAEQMRNELSVICSGAEFTKTEIRERIGKKYAYGFNSVRDFEFGSLVIDKFFEIDQTFAENILSEKANISFNCLMSMSKLSSDQLKYIADNMFKSEFDLKEWIRSTNAKSDLSHRSGVSVKNTPVYDPDAEISSLSLTIPSWINSIEKTHGAITGQISNTAAGILFDKLCDLSKSIEQIMKSVMEVI